MDATAKTVTNEDLMQTMQGMQVNMHSMQSDIQDLQGTMQDMMQMTSDGFLRLERRMDRLEQRMDRLEARMDTLESVVRQHTLEIAELKSIVQELVNSHKAYINDISDILDRITVLENRKPDITKEEFQEMQKLMHIVIDWARRAAKQIKVPVKIPS